MLDKIEDSKNKSNKKFAFSQAIILLFLFLGSMNFAGRYYYCIYFAFFVFCLFNRGTLKYDISALLLFILSLSILFFSPGSTEALTSMIKPFTYPLCYLMGMSILGKCNDELNKKNIKYEIQFEKIIVILAMAPLIHLILNMFINFNSTSRNTIDFWTREALSATGQTALACMAIGVACAFIFSNTKIISKLLSITTLLVILFYNLTLAGRTIIAMIFLVSVLALLHLLIYNKNPKRSFAIISLLILFILFVIYLYQKNVFNVQTVILDSNIYGRFFGKWSQSALNDNRFMYKSLFLSKMLDYPFGGAHIRGIVGNYAHDLYLDTYDDAGIFALFAVIAFIFISFKHLYRCMRNKEISFELRQLIFCIFIALYAEFLIEPVLLGIPWLFVSFCIIDGILSNYLYIIQNCKENESGKDGQKKKFALLK